MSLGPFADVAIPIPSRRVFTYAVPPEFDEILVPGMRVAVPFARRKAAGVIVRRHSEPPPVRAVRIGGVLDDEPIFDDELLAFLREAADYYIHPLGEVLRTAAPALRSEALKVLRAKGVIARTGELKGERVARKRETFATLVEGAAEPPRLGTKQREILALLAERKCVALRELRAHVRDPRPALRSLETHGLVTLEERDAVDPFFVVDVPADTPPALDDQQAVAVAALDEALSAAKPATFLLRGVTGSGKTEVYLHTIARAREQGRGALVLVPEIALTPQLVTRFRARFGDDIAVLHSGLTPGERDRAWRALREGRVRLAIGARSALFAPIRDLAIIVVDEEHDPSYKQEEGFRYQARDLAILRAHRAGAVCVLGSATPSLESWELAHSGRATLLTLPSRAGARPMPQVQIVDLANHRTGPSGDNRLSAPLHRALERCLAAQGQAVLFLNRRGFAPSMRCAKCNHVEECPSCSVTLTLHQRARLLRCHYCDFASAVDRACSACQEVALEAVGLGTEKLEDTLAKVFAPARVARLDRDTAAGAGVEEVLERVRRREVDLLVGTQMVTKGHDLPGVTLVGVILADQSLGFPDFRAAERTFQLLSQVAGRAGRGDEPGHVIIQTYQPTHPAVLAARAHDFEGFAQAEIESRRELGYPPFGRLAALRVDSPDEVIARRAAEELARTAEAMELVRTGRVDVLGPAPAPLARVRGRYRYRLLLRSPERRNLRAVALRLADRIDEGLGNARASVDVDPVSML